MAPQALVEAGGDDGQGRLGFARIEAVQGTVAHRQEGAGTGVEEGTGMRHPDAVAADGDSGGRQPPSAATRFGVGCLPCSKGARQATTDVFTPRRPVKAGIPPRWARESTRRDERLGR